MERLGDVLERTLKRLPLRQRLDDYALWTVWDETVGPAVARNAQPVGLRHGTLFVKVRAATWMQQLQYMKDIMVEKLNRRLEREVVTNVFFVLGDFPSDARTETPDAPPAPLDAARLPERELARVGNPELRDSLRRLFVNHLTKPRRGR